MIWAAHGVVHGGEALTIDDATVAAACFIHGEGLPSADPSVPRRPSGAGPHITPTRIWYSIRPWLKTGDTLK